MWFSIEHHGNVPPREMPALLGIEDLQSPEVPR